MAVGTNTTPNFLWKLRVKINTPDGGLNFSLHRAESNEADARAAFLDICNRLRAIMPSTCEIFMATMSKDNTKKDSRLIPEAIGDGLYGQGGVDPDPTTYNRFDDAFLLRFENAEGGEVPLKLAPIPDLEIVAGEAAHIPDSVVGTPAGALPAIGAQPVTFKTELENLMKAITKNCHHVVTKNHTPGGNYTYFAFENAHFLRVAKKKGGRVSTK